MKTRMVTFFSAFALSISICLFSNRFVGYSMNIVIKEAKQMEAHLNEDRKDDAFQSAEKLQKYIENKEQLLEGLVPHEDLHDLSMQIADAALSIKIGDIDDSKKAIELMIENAEHLIKHEAFMLGNIF